MSTIGSTYLLSSWYIIIKLPYFTGMLIFLGYTTDAAPDLRYLPSRIASPLFGRYQITLLGDRRMSHVCE